MVQFASRSLKITTTLVCLALATLSGCATQSSSGQVYRAGETRRAQTVEQGVVESVRQVTIQGDPSNVGTLAGGVLGGLAGSNIGRGNGRAAGAIVGAIAGGVVGQKVEQHANTRPGLEITVRMDHGQLRAFVQDDDEDFRPGDQVRILNQAGISRVSH
jgi:outer membrane lipoprotein SlyB